MNGEKVVGKKDFSFVALPAQYGTVDINFPETHHIAETCLKFMIVYS